MVRQAWSRCRATPYEENGTTGEKRALKAHVALGGRSRTPIRVDYARDDGRGRTCCGPLPDVVPATRPMREPRDRGSRTTSAWSSRRSLTMSKAQGRPAGAGAEKEED